MASEEAVMSYQLNLHLPVLLKKPAPEIKDNLQRLLDLTRGLPVEFIFKDISTCRNDVSRITQCCDMMRKIIEA
jgi:hypothetical protein